MKILQVHNRYQQAGGEDVVVDAERQLLEEAGHEVVRYERHNREIGRDARSRARAAAGALWASDSVAAIRALIARERPEVAHFHNTFPLISPGAYSACRRSGVPVVQTLHNYRLVCPAATLFRDGAVCEECLDSSLVASIRHGCYRESRLQSGVAAAGLAFHRWRKTWREEVDRFIALTEFARSKLIQGGLPEERVVVKPNSLPWHPEAGPEPGVEPRAERGEGNYLLFLGRLGEEKGLRTLARAWRQLPVEIPLLVAGDGPMRTALRGEFADRPDVRILGGLSRERALALLRNARCLVVPSEWYEGFPMILVEAFAFSVPVIASRLGSLAEIVRDGENGRLVTAGDSAAWARAVQDAQRNPQAMRALGKSARRDFELRYSAEANLASLEDIYDSVTTDFAPAPR